MSAGPRIPSSEITSEKLFFSRRQFLRAGITAASVAATGAMYRSLNRPGTKGVDSIGTPKLKGFVTAQSSFSTDEPQTPYQSITHYNNFTTNKEKVAAVAEPFVARPWSVTVDGLVHKPRTFDLEDILQIAPPEERVYRMRCVEGWSMVIPWAGFSLSRLLNLVEPLGTAKYVAFET